MNPEYKNDSPLAEEDRDEAGGLNQLTRRSALAATVAGLVATFADIPEAEAATKMRIETPKDTKTEAYVGYVRAIVKKAMNTKREAPEYYDQLMWSQLMINELAFHILFDSMQKNDCSVFMRNIMEGFKGPGAKSIAEMLESWAGSRDGKHNTMQVRYYYQPADPSTHYLKGLSHQPPFDSKENL